MALGPVAAVAEKADRDKPTHIEADTLVHDDLKQLSIFTGNAVLTKGTLVLRGARIEMREDPDGYQFGVVLPAPGKRAFFRQKREGVNEFIEGEGLRIEYDGKKDVVTILDKGEVRRYRGVNLADQMQGQRIVYENLTDVFSIDGQRPGSTSGSASSGGRVRATLVPKEKRDDKRDEKAEGRK
ncbi:MAG: lipopolysaccharide transport periplasmic protein LptA [Pseudomonadota bacterium]